MELIFTDWRDYTADKPASWIVDVRVTRYKNGISLASKDSDNSIEIGYNAISYRDGISIGKYNIGLEWYCYW